MRMNDASQATGVPAVPGQEPAGRAVAGGSLVPVATRQLCQKIPARLRHGRRWLNRGGLAPATGAGGWVGAQAQRPLSTVHESGLHLRPEYCGTAAKPGLL